MNQSGLAHRSLARTRCQCTLALINSRFRWVVCQIDRLERKSHQQAREAIKCLPRTLEETYEIMFLEIPQEDWYTARTALQWISAHSDLVLPGGIGASCLSSAILSVDDTHGSVPKESCHEHDFLKTILGCLIEVSDTQTDELNIISNTTCPHNVTLAHYTIQEFLFSDRVKQTKSSYFAMSRDTCARMVLENVLQTDYFSKGSHSYAPLGRYYFTIGRVLPYSSHWESMLACDVKFWKQYYVFFDKHRDHWNDGHAHYGRCPDESWQIFVPGHYRTNNLSTAKAQYLIALVHMGCISMIEKLLDELDLELTLSAPVPVMLRPVEVEGRPASREQGLATILDTFGAHSDSLCRLFLLEKLKAKMDLSRLHLRYLAAHYHENACRESCFLVHLLEIGADVNPSSCLLHPLQIAVRNWDLSAVETLLEYGADPDGIGQLDGYIPPHLTKTWSQASPLHILRNAEYGFTALECYFDLKVRLSPTYSHPRCRERVAIVREQVVYFDTTRTEIPLDMVRG